MSYPSDSQISRRPANWYPVHDQNGHRPITLRRAFRTQVPGPLNQRPISYGPLEPALGTQRNMHGVHPLGSNNRKHPDQTPFPVVSYVKPICS
jgi:hypothetical protein